MRAHCRLIYPEKVQGNLKAGSGESQQTANDSKFKLSSFARSITVHRTWNLTVLSLVFDTELQAFALSETGKISTVIMNSVTLVSSSKLQQINLQIQVSQ